MARVLPVVVALILAVYALIDCVQTDSSRIRYLNKIAWFAIILLVPVIGPILWLVLAKVSDRPVRRPAQPPAAPLPPDDNPEFLRELRNIDQEHERLLNDWEANLRRREEEVRKRDGDPDPAPEDEDPGRAERRDEDSAEEELRKRGDGGDDDTTR